MASNISYCDESWSPVTGCTPISEGCTNCWARRDIEGRLKNLPRYKNGFAVTLHPDRLDKPLHWRRPRVVLVSAMGDLFHEAIDSRFIGDVFSMIRRTPRHTYLLLTKRPKYMRDFVDGSPLAQGWPLANVWLGVTVCNQAEADEKIPILLDTPAAHYWLSVEPMLGPIQFDPEWFCAEWTYEGPGKGDGTSRTKGILSALDDGMRLRHGSIDQVIVGCESGPKRRRARDRWFRKLREECEAAGVPFYLKQAEEWQGLAFPRHNTPHGVGKVIHYDPQSGELAWRSQR